MFTLRMTCTLALTVAAVACTVSACGNSSSGTMFAMGDDASTSSTSGSSTSSSSGSSGSSSGKPDSSGGSSSGHDAGPTTCDPDGGRVPTNLKFDSSGNPVCLGNQGCDLKSNVCCIDTTTTVAA